MLLGLIHQIVHYLPQCHCFVRGERRNWAQLPQTKSLFFVRPKRGLPIGNLTSQIFANFYLRLLDGFISKRRGIFYGRYVDDMVVIHQNKNVLVGLVARVRLFLRRHYGLKLHPHKTLLQHYVKGFAFIGAFLLPRRIYAGSRLKQQFFTQIKLLPHMPIEQAVSVMNSYFGFLRHYNTLRLRLKGWQLIQSMGCSLCVEKHLLKVFISS